MFFVLRKNFRQVTLLHLVHHAFMPIGVWVTTKYTPLVPLLMIPTINTLVHVVMYSYYFMASVPSLKNYLWWKKYLTAMQLTQFLVIMIATFKFTFDPECQKLMPIGIWIVFYAFGVFILVGFSSFYINNYIKKKTV